MGKQIIILLSFVVIFGGCRISPKSKLEHALELSGANRQELQKVLDRYSENIEDSLKYQAAVFLIENMPNYYTLNDPKSDTLAIYYSIFKTSNRKPLEIVDSLEKRYSDAIFKDPVKEYDIEVIDSSFLCNNIELAFESLRYPWAKETSFADFCDYILPYRVDNEGLTGWRAEYLITYRSILDNIMKIDSAQNDDPIYIANHLKDSINSKYGPSKFTMIKPKGLKKTNALIAQNMAGTCDDLALFTISLLRTFGIVAAKDYIPLLAAGNYGHTWVSIKNHKGEYYNTDFFDNIYYVSDVSTNRLFIKTKVFRRTYSFNNNMYNDLLSYTKTYPYQFESDWFRHIDVTGLYSNNYTDLKIALSELEKSVDLTKPLYLCSPKWLNWEPIVWSSGLKNDTVFFNNIDGGGLYRLATYTEANGLEFVSYPFIFNKQTRKIEIYKDSDKRDSLAVYSKFSLEKENWIRNRLVGGVFEGSNTISFNKKDTLHIIKTLPYKLYSDRKIKPIRKYKYVRYVGPPNSYCDIAEISFYNNGLQLEGKPIGKSGAWKDTKEYEFPSALDGDIRTAYMHNVSNGGWVGLEFQKPQYVTDIKWAPRNYDNYVKPNDTYELFYCGKHDWISLGIKKAEADSLVYADVPNGALYYLKNHTGGSEERLFRIVKGKQEFL